MSSFPKNGIHGERKGRFLNNSSQFQKKGDTHAELGEKNIYFRKSLCVFKNLTLISEHCRGRAHQWTSWQRQWGLNEQRNSHALTDCIPWSWNVSSASHRSETGRFCASFLAFSQSLCDVTVWPRLLMQWSYAAFRTGLLAASAILGHTIHVPALAIFI